LSVSAKLRTRWPDISVAVVAVAGLLVIWSQYSNLSALSWWYEGTVRFREGRDLPPADYDLTTLPWQLARPQAFDVNQGTLALVTNTEPFAYQAYAIVPTRGADAAYVRFDADLAAGGATIGMLQAGKWLTLSSFQKAGPFSDSISARLGSRGPLTVMIANNNDAGQSRLTVRSLRVYLRK